MSVDNFIQGEIFEDSLPPLMESIDHNHENDPTRTLPPKGGAAAGTKEARSFRKRRPGLTSLPRLPENLPDFRVIRSTRRKKSIQAQRANGVIEIHIPDRLSRRQELEIIPEMIAMVLSRETRQRASNELLDRLALDLLTRYLPEFTERPSSIQWRPMRERWGSCTTLDRTIRIAEKLATSPEYVVAGVLFHELIHLRIPGHGPDFYELLDRYPERVRAEAYLAGFEAGAQAWPDPVEVEDIAEPGTL